MAKKRVVKGSTNSTTFFYESKKRNILNTKQVKDFLKKEARTSTKKYMDLLSKSIEKFSANPNNSTKDVINKTKREYLYKRDVRLSPVKKGNRQAKDSEGRKLWRDNKTGKVIKGKLVQKIVRKSISTKLEEYVAQKKGISLSKAKKFLTRQKKKKRMYQIFKQFYQ